MLSNIKELLSEPIVRSLFPSGCGYRIKRLKTGKVVLSTHGSLFALPYGKQPVSYLCREGELSSRQLLIAAQFSSVCIARGILDPNFTSAFVTITSILLTFLPILLERRHVGHAEVRRSRKRNHTVRGAEEVDLVLLTLSTASFHRLQPRSPTHFIPFPLERNIIKCVR